MTDLRLQCPADVGGKRACRTTAATSPWSPTCSDTPTPTTRRYRRSELEDRRDTLKALDR
jgi:hypothetical protein